MGEERGACRGAFGCVPFRPVVVRLSPRADMAQATGCLFPHVRVSVCRRQAEGSCVLCNGCAVIVLPGGGTPRQAVGRVRRGRQWEGRRSMKKKRVGGGKEGTARWPRGLARGVHGEDLPPRGAVPFRLATSPRPLGLFRASALGWRAGPLEEQLCVRGRQGVSQTSIPSIPRRTYFFHVRMSQTPPRSKF